MDTSFDAELKYLSDVIKIDDLKEVYESLSKEFIDDPKFLFFVGYILDVEPWALIKNYENANFADDLGYNFMVKAMHLKRTTNIYEWGVTKDPNKKKRLAAKILLELNQFPLNDKVMGRYFQRIFRAQNQEN